MTAGRSASGRSASSARSTAAAASTRRPAWVTCSTSRDVAAASTVVPWPASSTMRTDSSGSHSRRHVSRNVPLEPRPSSSVPHGTPRAVRRCSRCERRSPLGVRRSSSTVRVVASGFSRAARWAAARSRASGTWGAVGGTSPMASPTTSSSTTSGSPPSTDSAASRTSGSPARGRRRRAASESARRDAAIRWSGDAGMPRRRSMWAASTKNRDTPSGPGWAKTWAYQPGLTTPAP